MKGDFQALLTVAIREGIAKQLPPEEIVRSIMESLPNSKKGGGKRYLIRAALYLPFCWICGLRIFLQIPANVCESYSVDHIIPRSQGGISTLENIASAHRLCNAYRSATKAMKKKKEQKRLRKLINMKCRVVRMMREAGHLFSVIDTDIIAIDPQTVCPTILSGLSHYQIPNDNSDIVV